MASKKISKRVCKKAFKIPRKSKLPVLPEYARRIIQRAKEQHEYCFSLEIAILVKETKLRTLQDSLYSFQRVSPQNEYISAIVHDLTGRVIVLNREIDQLKNQFNNDCRAE